jgi:hypothetical protein
MSGIITLSRQKAREAALFQSRKKYRKYLWPRAHRIRRLFLRKFHVQDGGSGREGAVCHLSFQME